MMTFQYVIDADKPIAVKKILLNNLSSSENKKSSTSFLFISYRQNPLTFFFCYSEVSIFKENLILIFLFL